MTERDRPAIPVDPRIVVGENTTFLGAESWLQANGVEVVQMHSEECRKLLATFIATKPEVWNEDIGVE